MFRYLYKFNIFYEHQYGFRPKHNTNQPLLHLMNKIYETLNKSKPEFTLGIFLDFKKAFDCCDLDILHCGFNIVSNMWPTPGLKIILLRKKTEKITTCGVPQGGTKCFGALAVSSLYKRFAPRNIFFTSLFAGDNSFLKLSPDIASLIFDANTELKKQQNGFKQIACH